MQLWIDWHQSEDARLIVFGPTLVTSECHVCRVDEAGRRSVGGFTPTRRGFEFGDPPPLQPGASSPSTRERE